MVAANRFLILLAVVCQCAAAQAQAPAAAFAFQPGRARTVASQYAECSDAPRTVPVCVLAIGRIVPPE
jgi:hypothetical protein